MKYAVLLLLGFTTNAFSEMYEVSGIHSDFYFKTNKVIHIDREINKELKQSVDKDLLLTLGIPGNMLVLIDSPGGSISYGDDIIDILNHHRTLGIKIICVVTREASSMAFNILSTCDLRLAVERSTLMFHEVSDGDILESKHGWLTAKKLRALAKQLEEDTQEYKTINLKHLKMSSKDYDLYSENERDWRAKELYNLKYLHDLVVLKKVIDDTSK